MKKIYKVLAWAVSIAVAWGMVWAAQRADQAFLDFWKGGQSATGSLFSMLPEGVNQKLYGYSLGKYWKSLRTSEQGRAVLDTSPIRSSLEKWGIIGKDPTPFETWGMEYWGEDTLWGYDDHHRVGYLLTPMGTRGDCFQWLAKMFLSSVGKHLNWKPSESHGRMVFRAKDTSFWPEDLNVEFCFIQGVAVLGLGLQTHPLKNILSESKGPHRNKNLSEDGQRFLEAQQSRYQGVMGSFRSRDDNSQSLRFWSLLEVEKNKINFRLEIPSSADLVEEPSRELSQTLVRFRQDSDQISLYGSMAEIKTVWEKFSPKLPQKWTDLVSSLDKSVFLGGYQSIWDPILKNLGSEIYVAFAEGSAISSKYQIPFPKTVIAIPLEDRNPVIQALEATVLRLNKNEEANLLLRKSVRAAGEFYEVKMGESAWQKKHGLKELPVLGFIENFLVLSLDAASLNLLCDHLASNQGKASPEALQGVQLRVKLKESPQTIRVLLGVLGVLTSQEENMVLTPQVMKFLDEWLEVARKYSEIDLRLVPQNKKFLLEANLEL
jgi:hypothetical protein